MGASGKTDVEFASGSLPVMFGVSVLNEKWNGSSSILPAADVVPFGISTRTVLALANGLSGVNRSAVVPIHAVFPGTGGLMTRGEFAVVELSPILRNG